MAQAARVSKILITGLKPAPMQQDLGRTFPSNAWVSTAEGLAALRRVLLAFSAHSPRIGYCQSMNFLAAALLLALGRAEDSAFWVLVCLIDDGGAPRAAISGLSCHAWEPFEAYKACWGTDMFLQDQAPAS